MYTSSLCRLQFRFDVANQACDTPYLHPNNSYVYHLGKSDMVNLYIARHCFLHQLRQF